MARKMGTNGPRSRSSYSPPIEDPSWGELRYKYDPSWWKLEPLPHPKSSPPPDGIRALSGISTHGHASLPEEISAKIVGMEEGEREFDKLRNKDLGNGINCRSFYEPGFWKYHVDNYNFQDCFSTDKDIYKYQVEYLRNSPVIATTFPLNYAPYEVLKSVFGRTEKLRTLFIKNATIQDEEFQQLFEALSSNKNLPKVDITLPTFEELGPKSLDALVKLIKENKISGLRLGNAFVDDIEFVDQVKTYSDFGNQAATKIAQSLGKDNSMSHLMLINIGIGQKGASALSDMLQKNTTLHLLDLSGNVIDDEGAKKLAEAFETTENNKLRHIDFTNNTIGESGAEALKKAIMKFIERFDLPPTKILDILDGNPGEYIYKSLVKSAFGL